MKMRRWNRCFCGMALILTVVPVFAADPPSTAAGEEKSVGVDERSAESRKLLEEVLMARLSRELSLNEEQSVLMVRHLAEFREKMADIRRERMVLARNLRQALRDNKDDDTIGKLLDEIVAHEDKASTERRKFVNFEDFKLSTSQKARLYLFIVDFEGDMRRLLKQAQERRFGRGMKPGGAPENPPGAAAGETSAPVPEGEGDNAAVEGSPEKPQSP